MLVLFNYKKLGGWTEKSNEEKMQRKWIREISSGIGCAGINACPADILLSGIRGPAGIAGNWLFIHATQWWASNKSQPTLRGCLFKLDKIFHPFDAMHLSGYLLSFVSLPCRIDRTGQHNLALKRLHGNRQSADILIG